jgi:hypothetical protein
MSNRYVVWSTHVDGPDARHDVEELRRSDRKTAEEDAALIRDIFKRAAWVQDTESSAPQDTRFARNSLISCPLK